MEELGWRNIPVQGCRRSDTMDSVGYCLELARGRLRAHPAKCQVRGEGAGFRDKTEWAGGGEYLGVQFVERGEVAVQPDPHHAGPLGCGEDT